MPAIRMKRKTVTAKLESALLENKRVSIGRVFDEATEVHGYVVALGDDWVLLSQTRSSLATDGWFALRLRDIFSIAKLSETDGSDVQRRVLASFDEWPPAAPAGCNVRDLASIFETANRQTPLVSLWRDASHAFDYLVGKVLAVDQQHVTLACVDREGEWGRTRVLDVDDITAVEFGDLYATRLARVVEPYSAP